MNTLPVTGALTITNVYIGTNLTVASGGVVTDAGQSVVGGTLIVASGGTFKVINSAGNPFTDASVNGGTTVDHGGTMNVAGAITFSGLTNAGIVNVSAPIYYGANTNEILIQTGGEMTLGSNASIVIPAPTASFTNQGTIIQNAANATNAISYSTNAVVYISSNVTQGVSIYVPFQFDTSAGTISNLAGTLILASFHNPLAGTFYAGAAATIELGGGTTNAPLTPGSPLTLGGPGQYAFVSGYLYFPTVPIPNLALEGGLLQLGPAFEGGAITSLTLDGITLSNAVPGTLPVTGNFTVLNSGGAGSLNIGLPGWDGYFGNGVYGNYIVTNAGVMTVSNAVINGALTAKNGGILNAQPGSVLNGNVMVANGSVMNTSGSSSSGSVNVASGGFLNSIDFMASGHPVAGLAMSGPMTNAGTIRMTNSGLGFYNDGSTVLGSVVNQPGGVIDFLGNTGISGIGFNGGIAYLNNQGEIIKSGGTGFSGFNVMVATNSGSIVAQTGPIVLGLNWTFLPAGSLNVVINSATSYGSFFISTNGPPSLAGNASLAGAFNAILGGGYLPANGTSFNVVSYGSFTGGFTSVGLPASVNWQTNYGSTNFNLMAGSAKPQFAGYSRTGTNLVFNGIGGTPGSNYVVLMSTNVAAPLTSWAPLVTNVFDGTGQFHYTNGINPTKPREFLIFKVP